MNRYTQKVKKSSKRKSIKFTSKKKVIPILDASSHKDIKPISSTDLILQNLHKLKNPSSSHNTIKTPGALNYRLMKRYIM